MPQQVFFVDGVDWLLTGITFNAFGKSKADYITPYITVNGKKYSAAIVKDDNNYITNVVAALNETILEGTILQLQLYYTISLPDVSDELELKVPLNENKKNGCQHKMFQTWIVYQYLKKLIQV